jgi:hypothetical protein
MQQARTKATDLLLQLVNVAANLGSLGSKSGNNVCLSHAPNLGADWIHFMWRLRHNTENSL